MDNAIVTLDAAGQGAAALPSLFTPDPSAARRTLEFFTANIRNPNTPQAYARAGVDFAGWCEAHGMHELNEIEPVHVAAYVEQLQLAAAPSVKQRLAALRMLFDWLVVGQVMPINPAARCAGRGTPSRRARRRCCPPRRCGRSSTRSTRHADRASRPRAHRPDGLHLRARRRRGPDARWRMSTSSAGAPGFACMRRAASCTRCRATTTWRTTCMPTSMGAASTSRRATCFARPRAARAQLSDAADAAGRCVPHDLPAGGSCRHPNPHRLPQLSSDRHHRVPEERRAAGDRAADGQPRVRANDRASTTAATRSSSDEVERIMI